MKNNNISLELKKRMPFADWSWLLMALRQDDGVWSALESTDLGILALEELPANPEAWSPAALSLLALQKPIQVERLRSSNLQSLDENLLKQASKVYEDWVNNPYVPATISEAGLLALTLREQHRLGVSWGEALHIQGVSLKALRTSLACLYGMLPEPMGLLRVLCQSLQQDWAKLGVHILLANPHSPEIQLAALNSLASEFDPQTSLSLLQAVASYRPHLATLLARQVLTGLHAATSAGVGMILAPEGMDFVDELNRTLRTAQIHQIAGQADLAVPALADSLRVVRKLRGQISANLAHSVAQTRDVSAEEWGDTAQDASLEAWKQAVQLAPDDARYAAGYAKTLIKTRRVSDAAAYLKSVIEKEAYAPHPELMLTLARVLELQGQGENAGKAALKALELVQQGHPITERDFIFMVDYLLRTNKLEAALTAVCLGLDFYPSSRNLFALAAKTNFLIGKPEDALTSAYAAQAAGSYVKALSSHLTQESIEDDGETDSNTSSNVTTSDLQTLLIESLEAVGSWDAAYSERSAVLEGKSDPSKDELKALATCAFSAKKHDRVIEICRRLLQEDPDDLDLHRQIAESADAIGDLDTAIVHYSQTIQIAPEQAALWKGLVSVQNKAGLDTAAFESLRAASQALPQDGEIQLQLGELYLSQGAPTLALPCLRSAAAAASGASMERIIIRLGETLNQLGRLNEAREVLEPSYDHLNEFLLLAGNRVAKNHLEKDLFELARIYASTLLGLGEPEKAIPILTQILKVNGDDPDSLLDLADALMQLSDQASGARRAIPFLQRILGISPDGAQGAYSARLDDNPEGRGRARTLLADAYAAAGEYEKAMDAYRTALDEPVNHNSRMQTRLSVGLGMTALKLELPEMAVAALQEAAHVEPLNAQIQRNLCEAYLANELSQDAFQAANNALELSPSDLNTLVWFIDQSTRIATLPGSAVQPILSEVIHALRVALQQAPDRADLLVRLGKLLMQTGGRAESLEVFKKLAGLDLALQQVSIQELYQAAQVVLAAGDARLSATLLRKAITKLKSTQVDNDSSSDGALVGDLYELLVKSLEQLGDLDGALEVINEAIGFDKARLVFHISKADILYRLGKLDKARESLDESLIRWPENIGLRYRMARTLQALGDLPKALQQAELGISGIEEDLDSSQAKDLYLCAAGLANATLRSRRAFAYLQKAIPESDSNYHRMDYAIWRAELALEAGELEAAEQAVAEFESQAVSSARALAVCGLVACRRGDRDDGERKCRSAVRMWTKLQMGQPGQTPATSKEAFIAELAAVGMAAMENRQWKEAISIFKQLVEMFPEEPRAQYLLAQAMMLVAEAQALCQDMEVVKHAPGPDRLLEKAYRQYEECLQAAAEKAGNADVLKTDGVLENVDVEIKRTLGMCARRGRAVFKAILANANALEYLLQTVIPATDDVAALIMVYRRCGDVDRAMKSIQVGWHPVFNGKDSRKDPHIIIQLALVDPDVRSAVDLIMDSMASPVSSNIGWPEMPMMHYLVARLCHQIGDFTVARQAIKQALEAWPDEPRWQALAARITLSLPAENRLQQLADSIGYLEKAAAQEPGNCVHQLALGDIYIETGQNRQALQVFENATRLEPKNAAGWLALAKAQHLCGELDLAASSAERAIELSDDPVEALLLRAETALQTNNHRGALSRAQTVLRSQPENPQALYLLARALEGLNRPAEALEVLEKTLPIYENPTMMQLEKLQLIKRSQGLEAGLRALQDMVTQNPKQAGYLALLAEWLQEAGKMDAATQAARLALQEGLDGLTMQKRAQLHTLIGLQMRRAGQLDQAIQNLSEAISESSDHLEAYLELGRVYHDRREFQQALKVYQKAINLAGGDFRPYYQAGMVLKDNKDYMAAEAMLRRAAQLAPNEVAVHRLLGAVVALNLVHSRRLVPSSAK